MAEEQQEVMRFPGEPQQMDLGLYEQQWQAIESRLNDNNRWLQEVVERHRGNEERVRRHEREHER